MHTRDYQQHCVDDILAAIARGHKTALVSLFTGGGKTVIFSRLAQLCDRSSFLIVAPQRELVWQAAKTLDRVTGEFVEIEMADQWAVHGSRITVASRQTLLSGSPQRYVRHLGKRFVIVDEAHAQDSPAMIAMLEKFQEHGAHILGFTATPFRADGRRLGRFYQTTAYEMGLQEAIQQRWAPPPRAKIVKCRGLDLSNVAVAGGDYVASDLEMVIGASKPLHQVCLTIQKERTGQCIAFLPGVKSAFAAADLAVRSYGMNAAAICGSAFIQPEDERNRIINAYRRGDIDVLFNCQIAAMGFDAPATQTIVLARPTKSRSLWLQIVGRATRLSSDTLNNCPFANMSGWLGVVARQTAIARSSKPFFKVIDMTDETASHSLVTAVDMFARDADPEIVRRARQAAAAEDADPADPADLLAQAADDLRKAKLIEEGLAAMRGEASGVIDAKDVQIVQKKCISEYKVPLRGRHAGKRMGDLTDGEIDWALRQPSIRGWVRSYFHREKQRRTVAGRHGERTAFAVPAGRGVSTKGRGVGA